MCGECVRLVFFAFLLFLLFLAFPRFCLRPFRLFFFSLRDPSAFPAEPSRSLICLLPFPLDGSRRHLLFRFSFSASHRQSASGRSARSPFAPHVVVDSLCCADASGAYFASRGGSFPGRLQRHTDDSARRGRCVAAFPRSGQFAFASSLLWRGSRSLRRRRDEDYKRTAAGSSSLRRRMRVARKRRAAGQSNGSGYGAPWWRWRR